MSWVVTQYNHEDFLNGRDHDEVKERGVAPKRRERREEDSTSYNSLNENGYNRNYGL